uniref:ATP-binding protein n=1 Tax=[Ruminococcus] torques TaxID=33039 RepID=UPI002ED6134B
AHQLVEKMNGTITANSTQGTGTEFTLLFPLANKGSPVLLTGALIIFGTIFQIARLMQGCGKVNARLV